MNILPFLQTKLGDYSVIFIQVSGFYNIFARTSVTIHTRWLLLLFAANTTVRLAAVFFGLPKSGSTNLLLLLSLSRFCCFMYFRRSVVGSCSDVTFSGCCMLVFSQNVYSITGILLFVVLQNVFCVYRSYWLIFIWYSRCNYFSWLCT